MSQPAGAFPAPTWTPPAREAFVPLRPLTLGAVLAGSFRGLRHNTSVTLPPAILLSVGATVLGLVFAFLVLDPLVAQADLLDSSRGYQWATGAGAGWAGWLVGAALGFAIGIVQQGVAAADISHAVLGRRLTPGGFRRRMRGRWVPLAVWAVCWLVVLLVAGAVGIDAMAAAEISGGGFAGPLATMGVVAVGAVLLAWLGTKLALVPSALVVERARLRTAIGRSWRLTRRYFWRTFGIRVLAWTMIALATALVTLPVNLLTQLLASIVAGNGDLGDYDAVTSAGAVVAQLVGSVILAIGLVVTTGTDALLYLDLRMRHEGLDLELARFLEHRRPGVRFDPAEPDPYLPPAPATARTDLPAAPSTPPAGSPWA